MEKEREIEMINKMASCLIYLSKAHQHDTKSRVFACKTCNKEFPSFQALGGHRASHRRSAALEGHAPPSPKRVKPVKHECPICGAEFAVGQALGGHMRKHRGGGGSRSLAPAPVTMKKSGGGNGKRVLCMDLNLTPGENDNLKLELGRLGCIFQLVGCKDEYSCDGMHRYQFVAMIGPIGNLVRRHNGNGIATEVVSMVET
ncbi:hypothetical protein YC2023_046681 [Brassica napus]